MPQLNEKWRIDSPRGRSTRKASGSSKVASSRFADAYSTISFESTGSVTPWRVTSSLFVRHRPSTGGSNRRLSSTVVRISDGSATTRSQRFGRSSSRRHTQLVISDVVVSWPAISSWFTMPTTSLIAIGSPSSV